MALLISPFGKGGSGVLANCSLCGTEPLFPFRQTQYVQVFPLKPAPFCKLFDGLGSTNKSAIFLLSDSSMFSRSSFLLPQSLWQLPFHFFCTIRPQWGSPDTHFCRATTRLMNYPDGERYSCFLQFIVVSLPLSLVSIFFSRTGGVLSHLDSLTPKFPWVPLKNLCCLISAARDTVFC